MALLVKQGKFTNLLATGTQTIDVGFQPKAILFHSVRLEGDDDYAQASLANSPMAVMQGFATSPTEQNATYVYASYSGQGQNSVSADHCLWLGTDFTASSQSVSAQLTSVTSTSFTLTYDFVGLNAFAGEVFYTALGGDEVLGAKVLQVQKTSTGSLPVTGLGFQPNLLIQATSYNRITQGVMYNFGVATPTGGWSHSAASNNATSSGATSQILSNRFISGQLNSNTIYGIATLSSFNVDGFTLNFTTAMLPDEFTNILALKLTTAPVAGSITQPATASTTSVSGFAGAPKFMMFANRAATASTGYTNYAIINNGWTDGVEQFSTAGSRSIGAAAWTRQQYNQTINTYYNPPTQQGKAQTYGTATVSFNPTGFSANWSYTDGTAKQVVYLALLSASAAGETIDGEATLTAESNATLVAERLRAAGLLASSTSDTLISINRIKATTLNLDAASDLTYTGNADLLGVATLEGALDAIFIGSKVTQSDFIFSSDSDLYALGGKRLDSSATMSAQSDLAYTLTRLRRMAMRADYSGALHMNPLFGGLEVHRVRGQTYNLSSDLDIVVEFDSFGSGVSVRLSGNLNAEFTLNYIVGSGVTFTGLGEVSADGQIVKQSGFGLDATTDILIVPSYVRIGEFTLEGATDLHIDSNRWRQGIYNLSSRLNQSTQTNADYTTSAEYSSSLSQALEANRLRELEGAFSAESDFAFDLARIKASGLNLSSQLDAMVAVALITQSEISLDSVLHVEVVTNADYVSALNLESMSGLYVKASPILLVTYEDALGRTRNALVGQTQKGANTSVGRGGVQGQVSNQQHIGIERRHVNGKSR